MVRLADAEIERLKRDGPTADEVRKVKIERRRRQSMELDSVTAKARVLNPIAATHGDPLAYRSVLGSVFAVTPRTSGAWRKPTWAAAGSRSKFGPARAALRRRSRCRCRASPISHAIIRRVPAQGLVRPLGRARGRRRRRCVIPPAIMRRRLSNGLELRIVERHDLPIVKLKLVVKSGETSAPRGQGRPQLDDRQPARRRNKIAHGPATGSELIEIGASLSDRGTAGIEHRQPDHV